MPPLACFVVRPFRVLPLLILFGLAGCGVPGPPVPPTPKIPLPPTGLVAEQVGERVILRWALEQRNTDGSRREGWPQVIVHRAFLAEGADPAKAFPSRANVVYVIPGQVLELFLRGPGVEFPDVLNPEVLQQQAGRVAAYGLKAVNDKGEDAGFSNLATVRLHPVPQPIARIGVDVTEEAIELVWTPPRRTTGGTPIEAIAGYGIYRSRTGQEGSFALRGTAPTARYRDVQFRFGETYFYRVRTRAQFGRDTVESGDSTTVEVTPRDLFPPPAPANLIAVAGLQRVDLTWDASPAADLAGYNVYRRRESGEDFERLNSETLPAQSFADTAAPPGRRYFYAVTAVDAEGNESPFSKEAAAAPLPARKENLPQGPNGE